MNNLPNGKQGCNHSSARKERSAGGWTGEWVCDACGDFWTSKEALELAQRPAGVPESSSDMTFGELSALSPRDAASEISDLIHDKVAGMVNAGSLAGRIAETNASFFGVDELDVDRESIAVEPNGISCSANVQFSGEENGDSPACGNTIFGTISILIRPDMDFEVEEDGDFEIADY